MQSLSVATRKNESIRNTLARTRDRCRSQVCKQYEIKIDQSHLSKETLEHLERLFLEAKWFYNAFIASQDIFVLREDYKTRQVTVKDIRNKLIHKLTQTFQVICYQDDATKG